LPLIGIRSPREYISSGTKRGKNLRPAGYVFSTWPLPKIIIHRPRLPVKEARKGGAVRTAIGEIEKIGYIQKVKVKGRRIGLKRILKKLYEWSLIDGDVFLESKDWPYLWKK
jgi:hypothetical protein